MLIICERMSAEAFLLSDVSRLMRRRFDERARAIGVTRAQWRALTALARNEGIQQVGLADLLEVEAITACRMVDRLEEAGLAERRRAPGDRRAWRIHLTAKAHPLLDQLRALAEGVTEEVFDGIDADDRHRLTTTLERLRANLAAPSPVQDLAHG
jgi:DNA-binding MarR family transcriptional regulator